MADPIEYISQDSAINTTPTGGDSVLTIGGFDPPSDTTIIIVALTLLGGGVFNGAERDGQNFELAHSAVNGNSQSYILYLINPNMVVADINISIKNPIDTSKAVAVCFKNIDLDNVINTIADYAFDVNEGIATEITPSVDNCLIVDALGGDSGTIGLTEYQTVLLNDEVGSLSGSQYKIQGSASLQAMEWSWSGEIPVAHTLVAFNPLLDDGIPLIRRVGLLQST